jgi:hypothetical protein
MVGAESLDHILFVGTKANSEDVQQLCAFAIAKLRSNSIYVDVICALPGEGFGHQLLAFMESESRIEYKLIVLGALNTWLCEHYYAQRGYLETDAPCRLQRGGKGPVISRKGVFTIDVSPWDIKTEAELLRYCEEQEVEVTEDMSFTDIQSALEKRTWSGYRMAKCLCPMCLGDITKRTRTKDAEALKALQPRRATAAQTKAKEAAVPKKPVKRAASSPAPKYKPRAKKRPRK